MHIDTARIISSEEACRRMAPVLAPRLAARRLDLALYKDLLLAASGDAGDVLLLPDGAVIDGDLVLDWPHAALAGRPYRGVLAEGRLTVAGNILNESDDPGSFFAALGALSVRGIVKSAMTLLAAGRITASATIRCDLTHGSLRAYGGLSAPELIIGDDRFALPDSPLSLNLVLMEVEATELLLPDLFWSEGSGEPGQIDNLDDLGAVLRSRIEAGLPPCRPLRRRAG